MEPTDIVIGETYRTWGGKVITVTKFEDGKFAWTSPDGGAGVISPRRLASRIRGPLVTTNE